MLSKKQEDQLAELLKGLEPGFLPYEIFKQIARLVVLPIIEFVPLRENNEGQVEVLLLRRAQDDDIFPGEQHTPGTVIRPTDRVGNIFEAFDRILKEELKSTAVGPPYFVGSIFNESKRGKEQAQVYWVEVLGAPKVGTFYQIDSLPETFMSSQKKFVDQAARSFMVNKNITSRR